MQVCMFFGGDTDSFSAEMGDPPESIQLAAGITGRETYIRETLSLGDASLVVYRHESLTTEQVLVELLDAYRAWQKNRPGSRL